MTVRCQSDIVNTNKSALPVFDNPYHKNKRQVQKGGRLTFCWKVHIFYCFKDYYYDEKDGMMYIQWIISRCL